MTDYPFYDKQPGPERREKLNELYATWEAAIGNVVKGDKGWSPLIRAVADGERVVLQLYDWTGGQGVKPTQTGYLGATGYVSDISLAIDFRGPIGPQGLKGDKGDKGDVGDTGATATISVGSVTTGVPGTSASVDNSGTSSAAILNFTIPRGDKGEQGIQGVKGDQGDAGTPGINGNDGDSAYVVAVDNGFSGTESEWLASLRGSDGADGKDGAGLQIKGEIDSFVDFPNDADIGDGYIATDTGHLWIKGSDGIPFDAGKLNGVDGASAYDIAVSEGFTGTISDWLDSLKGEQGIQGEKGEQGIQGEKGDKGDAGEQGLPGATTIDGIVGLQDELNTKITDAPSDGKQYARKDSTWSEITATGDDRPIGSVHIGTRKPTSGVWVECDKVYLQSSYAELYAELGLLHDDVEATEISMPSLLDATTTIKGVATDGNIIVAVASAGTAVSTSVDGKVFQARSMPVSAAWSAVTFGNGLFVAISKGSNVAATSPDGINWTVRTMPVSADWAAITYGGGLFLAIANGSNVSATSADGITWTQRTMPRSAPWVGATCGILSGFNWFIAIAGESDNTANQSIYSSNDGINWTARSVPSSASTTWTGVAYGANQFIIVGKASSGTRIARTVNGTTWTQVSSTSNRLCCIAYGPGGFLARGENSGSSNYTDDSYSANGISWTSVTGRVSNLSDIYNTIIYAKNAYISFPTSVTTTTWLISSPSISTTYSNQEVFTLNGTTNWLFLGEVNGRRLAGGETTTIPNGVGAEYSSANGWTLISMPPARSIAHGNGTYVIGSSSGLYTSPDMVEWTKKTGIPGSDTSWMKVAFGNNVFIAANSGAVKAIYSVDNGSTWLPTSTPAAYGISLVYGNGVFLLLPNNTQTIHRSVDGVTWEVLTRKYHLNSVTINFVNGKFFTLPTASTAPPISFTSEDGSEWRPLNLPAPSSYTSIAYGGGVYVVCSFGMAFTSEDFIKWKPISLRLFTAMVSFFDNNFMFLASSNFSATMPLISYSSSTQFYVPKLYDATPELKQWMKAI